MARSNLVRGYTPVRSRFTFHVSRFSRWRELFWPSPYAWAGLAALWLVVLALNFTTAKTDSNPSQIAAAKPVRWSPDTRLALAQHLRLRAELTDTLVPAEPPKSIVNRPRTARQIETVAV